MNVIEHPTLNAWATAFAVSPYTCAWESKAIRLYDDQNRVERVVQIQMQGAETRALIFLSPCLAIEVAGSGRAMQANFIHERLNIPQAVSLDCSVYLGHLIEVIAEAVDALWAKYRNSVSEYEMINTYQELCEEQQRHNQAVRTVRFQQSRSILRNLGTRE